MAVPDVADGDRRDALALALQLVDDVEVGLAAAADAEEGDADADLVRASWAALAADSDRAGAGGRRLARRFDDSDFSLAIDGISSGMGMDAHVFDYLPRP